MAFDDVLFPTRFLVGSRGGPSFSTTVTTLGSGYEQRNRDWRDARMRYDVGAALKSREDLDVLRGFFLARGGRERAFRLRDPYDSTITAGSLLPVGEDGATFQLAQTYGPPSDPTPYSRVIQRASDVVVTVDGLETSPTISATGLVTFSQVPVGVLAWSGTFETVVRFDSDLMEFPLTRQADPIIQSIVLIETPLPSES